MSRIGKMPIEIPAGVTFTGQTGEVTVVGPKGQLTITLPDSFAIETKDNLVEVRITKTGVHPSRHGLLRAVMANAFIGVSRGWEKAVELVGVGYRVQGGDKEVTLSVGFSHPVKVNAPEGISFQIVDNTKITVSGIDKKLVGEIAAKLRAIKPPEPYKGKGIRYLGEIVRKKAGKAVKAVGAA